MCGGAGFPPPALASSCGLCGASRTPEDFSRQLAHALAHEPHPMDRAEYRRLTWEEATERFLDVTELGRKERAKPLEAAFDTFAYSTHNALTGAAPALACSAEPWTAGQAGGMCCGLPPPVCLPAVLSAVL